MAANKELLVHASDSGGVAFLGIVRDTGTKLTTCSTTASVGDLKVMLVVLGAQMEEQIPGMAAEIALALCDFAEAVEAKKEAE